MIRSLLRWLGPVLRLALVLLALGALLLLTFLEVARYQHATRGVGGGLASDEPPLEQPRFGVNVALERYPNDDALREALSTVTEAGLGVVRQRFSWAELEPAPGNYRWERWDHVLALVQEYNLKLIAVLETSPTWARHLWEADNPYAPPANLADFARFAQAFAARYGAQVLAYQLWDEPNIAPHWGNGPVDPAGYVALLRLASTAIRQVDPQARIIAGGLAPNLEPFGPFASRNLNELDFLREMYRHGAGAYFDILGCKAFGFWSGAYDRRTDPQVLNFSRTILLREEMVRRGDAGKPLWAMDAGWCALPEDWQGRPASQGNDTAFVQSERLRYAIQRVQQEWPWLGLMVMLQLQPSAPVDDPIWGYALLDPEGRPRPFLSQLAEILSGETVLYPGYTATPAPYARPNDGADATFYWWGNALDVALAPEVTGPLTVWLEDLGQIQTLDPTTERRRVAIVRDAMLRIHPLRLQGADAQAALAGVWVGYHVSRAPLGQALLAGLLGSIWLVWGAWQAGRRLPWRSAWHAVQQGYRAWPAAAQLGMVALLWLAVIAAPSPLVRLGVVMLYGLSALLRPDAALLVAVACIPLAPLFIRIGPGSFSLVEVSVLIAVAARLWNALLGERPAAPVRRLRPTLLDGLVLALLLLGLVTSALAEYQRVAWREFRVMLAEPVLLYALVRTWPCARRWPWQAVSGENLRGVLWLVGVGVAFYALAQYTLPQGAVEAEGVRRARAFYGSPNNLALILERILPLGLAVVAWGGGRVRRWAWGLSALPVGLVVLLTFSRGAWFLGLPALLITLALAGSLQPGASVRARRVLLITLGVLALATLALIPLAGTARLATLTNLSQGTSFLRISLWQAAWEMVRDHPWWGVGPDNFLYYYGDYIRPGAEVDRWLSHPHNLVLDFWLRLGLGGVIVLLLFLAAFTRRALRLIRYAPDPAQRTLALGLLAGMAAFAAHGLIDSAYFVTELAHWFMLAAALLVWLGEPTGPSPANRSPVV